jgi:hypothetical protein
MKFNKTRSEIRTVKTGQSSLKKRILRFCQRVKHKTYLIYFQSLHKSKKAITITWRTYRSGFTKNLLKNSNSKTGHSNFLRTETMKNYDRVFDEFDRNLELLKIAYKVYYRELNIDITIYSCNLYNQSSQLVTQVIQRARTHQGKPKD